MLQALKSRLGFLARGIHGFVQSHREPVIGIPSRLQKDVIGTSVEGRPIEAYRVGTGDVPILVIAGIHGNEAGSVRVARHLLAWFAEDIARFPHLSFIIVPSLNPDGRALAEQHPDWLGGGRKGRFNAHGVDLNRNFRTPGFKTTSVWSTGKNYSEEITVSCGPEPFSEPETQALERLVRTRKPVLLVSLHNVAADVMGNAMSLSQSIAQAFSNASGYRYVPPEEWEALGQTGTAREWCDSEGIAYLEIEGRYRWTADWESHRRGFEAVFRELERAFDTMKP